MIDFSLGEEQQAMQNLARDRAHEEMVRLEGAAAMEHLVIVQLLTRCGQVIVEWPHRAVPDVGRDKDLLCRMQTGGLGLKCKLTECTASASVPAGSWGRYSDMTEARE